MILVNELPIQERNLISTYFNEIDVDFLNKIETSSTVLFKGMILNVYNKKFKCQNFTVSYSSLACNLNFGFIINFYKIDNYFYALIQKLKKYKNFTDNSTLEERLNDFFMICELDTEFEIILLDQIINKCVLIENKNEYFISVYNELNEHD